MSYHRFKSESGEEYGSFETFHGTICFAEHHENPCGPGCNGCVEECDPSDLKEGWYWWACFPGCLPDNEPMGPFATEQEAIDDAQGGA